MRPGDEILSAVVKPGQYVGGEWNSVIKDPESVRVRFAFCFPDTYELGMSHLGMKILYHLKNERDDVWCERVFAPMTDMEDIMRAEGIPLFALESGDPVREFDFIGFTLQYEMSYTNVLNMIDLAGLEVRSAKRGPQDPLVVCGGPCATNPEPLAPFADIFIIGEGEEVNNELIDVYMDHQYSRDRSAESRTDFLIEASQLEGIYVPEFYDVTYNEDGTIERFFIKEEYASLAEKKGMNIPEKIRRRVIADLDSVYYPDKMVVPFLETKHDRITLEMFRGCIRGCRFCQAGFIYRPVRERSPERLLELARSLIQNTGYEEVGLMSLSTSDYTCLEEFVMPLLEETEKQRIGFSLPSLRIDSFSLDLMEKTSKVRKTGLTFAVEAGTQRLRDVINKGVTEEDLLQSVSLAFNGGWNSVKIYLMLGLPTETMEDVEGIAQLGYKLLAEWRKLPPEKRKRPVNITLSASSFVPKPFTPFQWEAQDRGEVLREKQRYLNDRINSKNIVFKYHESRISVLEGVLARGDRRVADVLESTWRKGSKFDSWDEHFKEENWNSAFEENAVDPSFYVNRKRDFSEHLPWDHIDIGVTKEFFIREAENAYKGIVTPNCREKCSACGVGSYKCGECVKDGRIGGGRAQSGVTGSGSDTVNGIATEKGTEVTSYE